MTMGYTVFFQRLKVFLVCRVAQCDQFAVIGGNDVSFAVQSCGRMYLLIPYVGISYTVVYCMKDPSS